MTVYNPGAQYATAGTFTKAQAITPDSDAVALALNGAAGGSARLAELNRSGLAGGHQPFGVSITGSQFSGTTDPAIFLGYNPPPILAGEPYAAYVIEADYNDGAKRVIEQYHEVRADDNTTNIRPLMFQFKRSPSTGTAGSLTRQVEMLTSAYICGEPLNVMRADGSTVIATFSGGNNTTTLGSPSDFDTVLSLEPRAGRGSSLRLGYAGTANAAQFATLSTTSAVFQANSQNVLRLYGKPASVNGACIAVGVDDNSAIGVFDAAGSSGLNRTGMVVRGKSGQSSNLLELQDSSSNPLSTFSENGYFTTRKTTIPADAELVAGELALWFDSTNGAAKLMVKAKQADGTVKTASVALA